MPGQLQTTKMTELWRTDNGLMVRVSKTFIREKSCFTFVSDLRESDLEKTLSQINIPGLIFQKKFIDVIVKGS